jgi:hypothetical protein
MPLPSDAPPAFKPETVRGAAGFFRVGQSSTGAWSLIDPDNRPFFASAVNEIASEGKSPDALAAQLRSWGFNLIGAASDPGLRDSGLAFVAAVDFCGARRPIRAAGVRLPDVFDPAWQETADERASLVCTAARESRELLGWLADDALAWGRAEDGRPSLLQICLSLEPSFAAYHAAWEFVLAPHRGNLAGLAKAWAQPLANKEVVRELTRAEQGLRSRGYLRDHARWLHEFALRYFTTTTAAIRAHDPNHLVLGARQIAPGTPSGSTALEQMSAVDIAWRPAGEIGPAAMGPVFASDFTWAREVFWRAAPSARARGLTSVERMLRRGRVALHKCVAHPAVVGWAWRQWCDRPDEQPPFGGGLVHANGAAAREHTELVADILLGIDSLRRFPASLSSP